MQVLVSLMICSFQCYLHPRDQVLVWLMIWTIQYHLWLRYPVLVSLVIPNSLVVETFWHEQETTPVFTNKSFTSSSSGEMFTRTFGSIHHIDLHTVYCKPVIYVLPASGLYQPQKLSTTTTTTVVLLLQRLLARPTSTSWWWRIHITMYQSVPSAYEDASCNIVSVTPH